MRFTIPDAVKKHLAFQWSLKGFCALRFFYVFLYYLLYLLTSDKKAQALLKPLSPIKIYIVLPGGLKMRCSLFDAFIVVKEVFADSIYERLEPYRVKAGQTVVDIGAQIGSYSVKAASQSGGPVVSVEPFAGSFELLSRNASENGLNIKPVNATLSDFEGEAHLYVNDILSGSNSLVFKTGKTQKVRVTTLDRLLGEPGVGKVDVIKIDTEGSELKILKGAPGTLATGGLKLVMEIHGQRDLLEISAFLTANGFIIDLQEPDYIYARAR